MSASSAPAWLPRLSALLAAAWMGLVLALALVAAPVAFALLDRPLAGQLAGRMFAIEAQAGLGMALLLFLIERRLAAAQAAQGRGSVLSAPMLLVLGALFCTVLGYFALQPMMAQARAGMPTPLSFGALHAVSSVFFGLKGLLLAALVWRRAGG
jgi:hypothetical protein